MTKLFEPMRAAIQEADPAATPTAFATVWLGGDVPALNFLVCADTPQDLRRLSGLLRFQADALLGQADAAALATMENSIGADGRPVPLRLPRESPWG